MIRFRPEMMIRFTFRLALILLLSAGLAGFDQPSVKRSAVERSGRGWVQRLECSAPVREGGKLVLRAHFGSVEVKAGASDRMECKDLQERLLAYLYEELPAEDRAVCDAHLAHCAQCQSELEKTRRLHHLLSERPAEEPSPALLVECREALSNALDR
ncbi:MAG: hypothetical protein DMG23_13270, partial [Acidobacteria bacterium]